MADIGNDFDGPLRVASAGPRILHSGVAEHRLVAEVDESGVWGDMTVVWLYADHGGRSLEPVPWPDDWPIDITLDEMRERGVEVRE